MSINDSTPADPVGLTGEAYYDAHIAPKLAALSKECVDHGLSLVALCEWEPGVFASTFAPLSETGLGLRFAYLAAHANGNVDSLIRGIMQHAHVHGHSSFLLRKLGVPSHPEASPALSHPTAVVPNPGSNKESP